MMFICFSDPDKPRTQEITPRVFYYDEFFILLYCVKCKESSVLSKNHSSMLSLVGSQITSILFSAQSIHKWNFTKGTKMTYSFL